MSEQEASETAVAEFFTQLMTPRQIAAQAGVTTATVHRWFRLHGAPRATVIGGRRRYAPAAVRAWLDARVVPQPSTREHGRVTCPERVRRRA